jgi:hypothetical protein
VRRARTDGDVARVGLVVPARVGAEAGVLEGRPVRDGRARARRVDRGRQAALVVAAACTTSPTIRRDGTVGVADAHRLPESHREGR